MCEHYFHGLYMPSNKPDVDIIPFTLNNGGIIADYCDECAINNTVDELTDNLYNLLPEESKGRYAVSLAYGGETFPLPLMRNCLEMRAPAAFRSFFAQYQRRLHKYESSTKLWNNCCHAGVPVKAFAENNGVASLETLGLECVVCNEPFQYRRRDDDDAGSPRRPRVLPCGHILCGRCLLAYYETGESRCPTCRTELIHECGHAHTGMPMPLTRLDRLPPILSQGGGMPKGCSPCGIVGLLKLFDQELSNSPDIAEELKGEYLGIGIKLSDSDEYCSRDVTGPVLEIEPPAAIKQLINDIVDSAIESQRENEV
ncbi:hypothetical protein NW765_003391 [Fusarium oxysporum]|nr:hypothetical protein NW765_003391 [Fusarium oxysporum]KAJ4279793.1 hypothetical protein NW764_005660 [Fusarium oxysporum]